MEGKISATIDTRTNVFIFLLIKFISGHSKVETQNKVAYKINKILKQHKLEQGIGIGACQPLPLLLGGGPHIWVGMSQRLHEARPP